MAWVFGGKKFGQYTYEHWFDDVELTKENAQKEITDNNLQEAEAALKETDSTSPADSTAPDKSSR